MYKIQGKIILLKIITKIDLLPLNYRIKISTNKIIKRIL